MAGEDDPQEGSSEVSSNKKINMIVGVAMLIFWGLFGCACLVAGFRYFSTLNPRIGPGIVAGKTPQSPPNPLLTATPLPNPQLHPGQIIYSRTFSLTGPWPWNIGHSDTSYLTLDRRISNGKYVWNATAKKGVTSYILPATKINILVDNYQFSVDARMVEGPPNGAYGLFFNWEDSDNYWAWIVRANGTSVLEQFVGGRWANNPVKMVFPISANQTHTLTMQVSADTLNFYVDGAQVGYYKTAVPEKENFTTSKKFGIGIELSAGDKATFEFDKIIISNPDTP